MPAFKRILLSLVAASLLLQSLFPSGYMPASLASGWVAMLCPDGLPAAFVDKLNARATAQSDHAHHHHSGHHGNQHDHSPGEASEGSCQLGSALDQPDVSAPAQAFSASAEVVLAIPLPQVLRSTRDTFLAPPSRGPPAA